MTKRFAGKSVLVTAAAAGIGRATAEAFARAGARVVLADIDDRGGQATCDALAAEGCDVAFLHTDATSEADVAALIRFGVDRMGGLDIAANVAGGGHPTAAGPEFHTQGLEGWDFTIGLSLTSVFLSMKHEIAHMADHRGGTIVNVTSLAGLLHVPIAGAAYAAAKAGVIRLTKFAAVNYAARGIRVNCIAPGVVPTAGYETAGPEIAQAIIADLVTHQPIARTISPAEQAAAILWLCSDEAAMVTGQVLPIDGGWSAQ
jgi:NAD(P)-dependent dehydrogenase (short-subunit alcohol dehydrogenase family)